MVLITTVTNSAVIHGTLVSMVEWPGHSWILVKVFILEDAGCLWHRREPVDGVSGKREEKDGVVEVGA